MTTAGKLQTNYAMQRAIPNGWHERHSNCVCPEWASNSFQS